MSVTRKCKLKKMKSTVPTAEFTDLKHLAVEKEKFQCEDYPKEKTAESPTSRNGTNEGKNNRLSDYCQTFRFIDHNGQEKEFVFPKGLDLDRPKRARTTFSEQQLHCLEQEFCRNQYLVGSQRNRLADRLGLSETQVKVWFQNRRTKLKRDTNKTKECSRNQEKSRTSNYLHLPSPHDPSSVLYTPIFSSPAVMAVPYWNPFVT